MLASVENSQVAGRRRFNWQVPQARVCPNRSRRRGAANSQAERQYLEPAQIVPTPQNRAALPLWLCPVGRIKKHPAERRDWISARRHWIGDRLIKLLDQRDPSGQGKIARSGRRCYEFASLVLKRRHGQPKPLRVPELHVADRSRRRFDLRRYSFVAGASAASVGQLISLPTLIPLVRQVGPTASRW